MNLKSIIKYLAILLAIIPTVFSWYDYRFLKRVPLNVTLTITSAQVCYGCQIAILLNVTNVTEGKALPDLSNILITTINGTQEVPVPFYPEPSSNGLYRIWLKMPAIYYGTHNYTLYIYYENITPVHIKYDPNEVFILYDDFEKGIINTSIWQMGGSVSPAWMICTDRKIGNYSACSNPAVNDNQYVYIRARIYVPYTDARFDYCWAVSSEYRYDWLRLYIDGNQVNRISGERQMYCTFTTIHGQGWHTIEFRYTKDGSITRGADRGWIDNIKIYTNIGTDLQPYIGKPQTLFLANITILQPQNNTYYRTTEIPIEFKAVVYQGADKFDVINVTIDNTTYFSFYDVPNNTIIKRTVNLTEGRHVLKIIYSGRGLVASTKPVIFYIDVTPPSISFSPEGTVRIHHPNETIIFRANVTDNLGIAYCKVIFNNTEYPCEFNITIPADLQYQKTYQILVEAQDLAGNLNIYNTYVSFDISEGKPIITEVLYPPRVPAKNFTIKATVECINDWCENVNVTLLAPRVCVFQSPQTYNLGDMDILQTKTVTWSLRCAYANNYTFKVIAASSNGNNSTKEFILYPPEIKVWLTPEKPTDNDDIVIYAHPEGFGVNITLGYFIYIIRNTEQIPVASGFVNITDNTTAIIYGVSKNVTRAGDILVYKVWLAEPKFFYFEVKGNTTIVEYQPPVFLSYKLKYPNKAPEDDNQTVTFTVYDNTIVKKVILWVYINGTYTKYDEKEVNKQQATVTFTIRHTPDMINETIRLFAEAIDEFNNTATSDVLTYTIVKDKPPVIYIDTPRNNTYFNRKNIAVVIKPIDDFSPTITCSVNGITKTIQNNTFTLYSLTLPEGRNTITIRCTDTFGNSRTKVLYETIDVTPPEVEAIKYYIEANGTTYFHVTVKDNIELAYIKYKIVSDNRTVAEKTINLTGTSQEVTFIEDLSPYVGETLNFTVTVCDKAHNCITTKPITIFVTRTTQIKVVPVIKIAPSFNVSIRYEKPNKLIITLAGYTSAHCYLYYDSSELDLGTITSPYILYFNKTGVTVYVKCVAPNGITAVSNTITIPKKKVAPIAPVPAMFSALANPLKPENAPYALAFYTGLLLALYGFVIRNLIALTAGMGISLVVVPIVYGLLAGDPLSIAFGSAMGFIVFLLSRILLV